MTQSEQMSKVGTLLPGVRISDLKIAISAALVDCAKEQSRLIGVVTDASGGVTLRGIVGTWTERHQAELACWAVPGISFVDNQLRVTH
jgi:osmotically-inducible protein OsmY